MWQIEGRGNLTSIPLLLRGEDKGEGELLSILVSKVEKIYLERLHAMTGEERMKRAFEMCKFMWKIAEQSIRNEYPNISEKELKEKLKQKLHQ